MTKIIFLISLLCIMVVGGLFWFYTMKKGPVIVEMKDFSCPEMGNFTFRYPVFEGWEAEADINPKDNICNIYFNRPLGPNFESTPLVQIEKVPELLLVSSGPKVQETKDGLEFYGEKFGVRISFTSNLDEEFGFSRDVFAQEVMKSFQWIADFIE